MNYNGILLVSLALLLFQKMQSISRVAALTSIFMILTAPTQAATLSAAVLAPGKTEIARLRAEGVQIYQCEASSSGAPTWRFLEPFAVLLKNGATVGRHFAGPTWQLASGSTIVAKVEGQSSGRTQKDIALLKLGVIREAGGGEFARVTTVQRLDTQGGNFGGSCNSLGALHLEPYTADYVFLAG